MGRRIAFLGALAAGVAAVVFTWNSAAAHNVRHPGHTSRIRELFVPGNWAGQWTFQVKYWDSSTGNLIATEEVADTICPGDRLGLSSYIGRRGHHDRDHDDEGPLDSAVMAGCTGTVKDDHLDMTCESRLTAHDCRIDFSIDVSARRDADAFTGSGDWRVTATAGNCEPFLGGASLGETVQVSGVRTSTDLAACSAPPASVIEKLLSQPELMRLLPPPIEDLSAQPFRRSVYLRWTRVPNAAAYTIYRAPVDGPFEPIARRPGRWPRYFDHWDHRLRHTETYRYVVRWTDAEGRESPVSNEVSATTAIGHHK